MKKSRAYSIITILAIMLSLAVTTAATAVNRARENQWYVAVNYRHAFSELVSAISELDTSLQKSLLTTSPSLAAATCAELFARAQVAETALGVLPFSTVELEKTAGFINTVGDYALSLSHKAGRGERFTQEEMDGLRALSETARVLSQKIKELDLSIGSQVVDPEEYVPSMEELDRRESEFVPQNLADGVSLAMEELPELPTLIYDGPFSEHLTDASPKLLEGMVSISASRGREIAAEFIGARLEQVYLVGEQEGNLPAYCYGVKQGDQPVCIWVTKQGGVVCDMLNCGAVTGSRLSPEQALETAKAQLEKWGFTDMKSSYYMIEGNVLTANFAYEQDGVVCYPDLIKVGVAMDDGAIQSFEAKGYVSSHTKRELPPPEISAEDARSKVPEDLIVESENLALIPTAGGHEVLCHEFLCTMEDGGHSLIYVNAESGEQEKILLLLEEENGTLTV